MADSFAPPLKQEHTSTFDDQWDRIAESDRPPLLKSTPPGGRRIGLRASLSMPAALWADETLTCCRATEISTSGVVISGCRSLPPGKRVLLYLMATKGLPLRLEARAVRSAEGKEAFEIEGLNDQARLRLAELIDEAAKAEEPLPFELVRRRAG